MLTIVKNKLSSHLSDLRYATNALIARCRIVSRPQYNNYPISLVVVGRNDDYMPDFFQRLCATLRWNIKHLIAEPIFVEWNPPSDRDFLAFRLTKEFPTLKAYVVSHSIHNKVCQNQNLALMEYHAKNVGIRRAQSKWIIASNADIVFSPSTILNCRQFITNSVVNDESSVLTAQRVDIDWAEMRQSSINILDCVRFKKIITQTIYGTGDFLMTSRTLWHTVRGYDESLLKHRVGCDVRGAAQILAHQGKIQQIGTVLHLAHPTSCTEAGIQPHHGECASLDGVPYENDSAWGLGSCNEEQIGERVWLLS